MKKRNYKIKFIASTAKQTKSNWLLLIILIILISGSSCRKLVETDPPSDRLTGASVFLSDATAIAVFNNIYRSFNTSPSFQGATSITLLSGLGSDELALFSGIATDLYIGYYRNTLANQAGLPISGGEQWTQFYGLLIYKINDALDGLSKSTKLTPVVKSQLTGEAKFLRAFCYFYLVNLFGDVPLVLTTDYQVNSMLFKSTKAKVCEQIIADLNEAETFLSPDFPDISLTGTTSERVRPTKWAASALLARAYLYNGNLTGDAGNYANAEDRASDIISNNSLFQLLPSLNNVFLKNSREAIWQIQPTESNLNTLDGQTFVIPPTGPSIGVNANPVYLSKTLFNSFEINDKRKVYGNWVDTTIYTVSQSPLIRDTVTYVYKYKVFASPGVSTPGAMTEYFMMLRLGEQYLIRAEARAKQNNIGGAQSDLNAIRNRAGLPNTIAGDQTSLLTAILNERRHELFCEWGHRWLDLKRTNTIDAVMTVATPLKSNGTTTWQPYQALYPIPYTELQKAPNLTQNPGYQ